MIITEVKAALSRGCTKMLLTFGVGRCDTTFLLKVFGFVRFDDPHTVKRKHIHAVAMDTGSWYCTLNIIALIERMEDSPCTSRAMSGAMSRQVYNYSSLPFTSVKGLRGAPGTSRILEKKRVHKAHFGLGGLCGIIFINSSAFDFC